MYYNTQILNKYNLVYTNYITNQAITRQSVPNEYRLINTIICYLDFKGFLHVELFVGTEDEISDEQWIDDINWVTTAFIYHKCYNEEYNVDFSTTALQVPCCVRYRGNILHIQNYPMLDSCGEIYYEDKTYRYTCFCCDDDKYSNIDNWEEYDFQLIINDIVKFITDIMTEANDISYGILTPDEEMIKDLIEQLFNEWLTEERLTEIVNVWLEGQDLQSIINQYLDDIDLQEQIKQEVQKQLSQYDFEGDIANYIDKWFEQNNIQDIVNNAVSNYFGDNINDILNNYFNGEGNDNLTQIVNDLLDDKIGEYLESIKTMLANNERVVANALSRHEEDILTIKG